MRDLAALPKAHLHLHFTGSMSIPTLLDLGELADIPIPRRLTDTDALRVPATVRGWARFQRSYDVARAVVTSEEAMRRIVRAAAREDKAEGSRRLEIQVDPTSYARHVNGIVRALELVLDEAALASRDEGISIGVIVAASRVRHPLEARTLARLAAKHAGQGPGQVCGFGLSNDERRGATPDWSGAFKIARNAGIPGVPHAGELSGPDHVAIVVESLRPRRIGHGVRTVEDPDLLRRVVDAGIALEVCPASNVQLGVYDTHLEVPLSALLEAGATVALGADDPLLFLARLTDQYEIARHEHGLTDEQLADLARMSINASFAPEEDKRAWLAEVDAWLAGPSVLPEQLVAIDDDDDAEQRGRDDHAEAHRSQGEAASRGTP